jgi:hypothetical protein|tara:strand:- start:479 stop:1504 length:1026 start_codon:yes stop_codon:yes gene_type:complete
VNYFDIEAISNSSLAYIDPLSGGNPRLFRKFLDGKLPSIDSKAFEIGTLIHAELLEPGTVDVVEENIPAPKVREVLDSMWLRLYGSVPLEESLPIVELEDMDPLTFNACIPDDFYPKWKGETRRAKIIKEGASYWNALYLNRGKTMLDPADYHVVTGAVESLKLHPTAINMLQGNFEDNYEEAVSELELTWTETWAVFGTEEVVELPMKSKLDRVLFNHTKKTMALVDLKTTRTPIGKFGDTIFKYNYHRQLAFYQLALTRAYPEYTFVDSYITVVQTNKEYPVECFHIEEDLLNLGWELMCSLIDRVAYHTHLGNWGNSMETILGGIINISVEGADYGDE